MAKLPKNRTNEHSLFDNPDMDEIHTYLMTMSHEELLLIIQICADTLYDSGIQPRLIDVNDYIDYPTRVYTKNPLGY